MRISFVTRAYWPALGGQENYLRNVATALAEAHEVTVVAQTNANDHAVQGGRLAGLAARYPQFAPFRDGGVNVTQLRPDGSHQRYLAPSQLTVVRPFSRYAYTRTARRALVQLLWLAVGPQLVHHLEGSDVVHMWGGDLLGWVAQRAASLARTPFLVTPFAHPGQHGDDAFSAELYRTADVVTALLEADRHVYERLGVDPARLAVIPVCAPGASARRVDVRADRRISGPLVLFLAARRSYKGLDLLLEAQAMLATALPELTLAIAGPGGPIDVPARGRIIDLGSIDDLEAADWLHAADLLCLPSRHEIFPVSFLEAWSANTAVVSSDIPPLAELMSISGGGLTASLDPVSLADAIAKLAADPELAKKMGRLGHQWWSDHATPPKVAGQFAALYAGVCGA